MMNVQSLVSSARSHGGAQRGSVPLRIAKSGLEPVRTLVMMIAALIFAAALSLTAGLVPAMAAGEPSAPQGWARVAHLSPDTKSVDVALTAVAGGQILFDLEDVAYGDVSDYLRLPVGSYVVDMTPSGSADDTAPALSQLITVKEGQPITLAVLGKNADLTAKVVTDDLTAPADGQARVRVIQASTIADTVEIQTSMGATIAADAKSGDITGYATVEDGLWDLQLFADAQKSEASIDLASGSVNTLLVLDNASGGLTVKAISDSGSVTETPVGGTNTGAAPVDLRPLDGTPTGAAASTSEASSSWHAVLIVAAGVIAILLTAGVGPRKPQPTLNRRRP